MDKTPSSFAVDKYMSKILKNILTRTKKFKIIVLVAEVWYVNFFFSFFLLQFSHFNMCLNENAQYSKT